MTVSVFLGLGSNIQPQQNIQQCLCALRAVFGKLIVSPFYECESIGFSGPNFLNGVVSFETLMSPEVIFERCREIEIVHGRDMQAKKWSSRTLDIDLLLYGHQVGEFSGVELPRSDILEYAFVLWPLSDIASNVMHPLANKSYGALRQELHFTQKISLSTYSFTEEAEYS